MTHTNVSRWLMLAAAAAPALGAQAPPVEHIPDRVSCEACAIELNTLGASDGDGMFAAIPMSATVDRLGRYWVVVGGELPRVFDPKGGFLRTVGAAGRGPGEFARAIDVHVVPGDSVVVIDGAELRATLIAPNLSAARTIKLPFAPRPSLVVRWPGNIWLNGNPAGSGWPLHRVSFASTSAELVSSFGPGNGELHPRMGNTNSQFIAASNADQVWSADKYQYRLTNWSLTGTKRSTLERQPDWFATASRAWIGNTTTPPPPALAGVQEDSLGYIWVFVNVPSPRWRDAWSQIAPTSREVSVRQIATEKLYRTAIEIIDPVQKRVVARRFVDEWIMGVLPGGRVAIGTVDSTGVPRLVIASFQLRGQ